MTRPNCHTLLLLLGTALLFAACSGKSREDDSWYKPIDEFVNSHQPLMQNQPDSMMELVRRIPCEGNPELSDQWKRLIIAKCHFLKAEDDACQNLIDSVNAFCRQYPDRQIACKLQSYADNLHGILMQTTGQRDSALVAYIKAYGEMMQLSQRGEAIDICINIADVSRQLGRLADASSWYRRASFLADSLHLDQAQNSILAGLGQVYNDLQNYQQAHYYFQKAEEKYPPQNPKDAHFFYNSWGNVYSSQGKPDEALKCFRKAQKASLLIKHPLMTAIVDANLGQTFLELNQTDSAQKYLALTSRFFLQQSDMQSDTQFYVDGLNAALALRQDNLPKAAAILSKPYDLSRMSPNYLYIYHKGLSNLYERKGQYAKALKYRKLMQQYDDSLRNATMVSSVSENELRFKQDTAIVRRDITLRATQAEARSSRIILMLVIILLAVGATALVFFYHNKMLRQANRYNQEMKRMMALKMENVRNRFSPHFVFNVLNIFISNLPRNIDTKSLRLLIQLLRTNLLVCDKTAVSLNEELEMVKSYACLRHETNPDLPLPQIDIAPDVDLNLMVPSMIIQIPVENAMKHAFVDWKETDEHPQLDIKVWMEEDMLRIHIIDNGCGMGMGNVTRKKANSAVSTGTGLRILNSTIEMLNLHNPKKMYFRMQSNTPSTNSTNASSKGTCVSIGVPLDYNYDLS